MLKKGDEPSPCLERFEYAVGGPLTLVEVMVLSWRTGAQ